MDPWTPAHDGQDGPAGTPPATRSWPTRLLAWVVAGPPAPLVIALWVVVVVLMQTARSPVATTEQSVGSIIPADTPAVVAEERSVREFGIPTLSRTVVVQRDAGGLSRADQLAAVERAVDVAGGGLREQFPRLRLALPVINERSILPVSREDETTIVTYLFFDAGAGWNDRRNAALEYSATLPGDDPSGLGVTGLIPARIVQDDAILGRLHLVEAATVAVIALIVGVAFRSLVAPLVTMAVGGVAYLTALKAVTWAGAELGFPTPPELRPLMVVLLLGIVTDYVVFLLSGTRYHLAGGAGRSRAARAAVEEYGPVIIIAGIMVAAGAGVLVIASTRIFRAFGPGMAFTVLVGLVVAVTLAPALLAVLGRFAFWPSPPRPWPGLGAAGADETPVRGTFLSRLLARRPAAAAMVVLTVAALIAAAAPLRDASLGFDVIGGLPADAGPRTAAEAAAQGFAAGILSPTEVVVRGPDVVREREALVRLQRLIEGTPGVTGVLGPAQRPQAVTEVRSTLRVDQALILAPGGDAARYLVVFDADPAGSAGISRYDGLRARMPALLREAGLTDVQVSYAGDTAVAQQVIDRTLSDLIRIALAVVLVDFLLLVLFLRALVAPLFLIVASVLALAASAGITVVIFQRLFGVQDIVYYVPFAAAVLLVSLGSDYNIFLVGRVWDEARATPLRQAVERGVPRATRAISIAALALAASFALLGLIDVAAFRQLAVLLAVGVLVDAFFVRSLLVPSLITLFGHASAWPGRRARQSAERA